jgi:alginate O-acetyltransferase complex protein AlgI
MKSWGGIDVWLLGAGFGFLLFFDFAGYSHMVIGAARIFGIRVAENFDRPFLSTTPSVFWTRWHMSLSFWIRDYVFNPLAAAGRRHTWWPYMGLIISMTLFGVWHGPRWTYTLYGVYHGCVLVIHRLGHRMTRRFRLPLPGCVATALAWGATFGAASVGFVIFRAENLAHAWAMLRTLVTPTSYGRFTMPTSFYIVTAAIVVGYFVAVAGHSLLLRWRAAYKETMRARIELTENEWSPANNFTLMIGAAFDFLTDRLWWWLAPGISILAFGVGFVIHTRGAAVSVSPFIYTLF